MTGSAPQNKPRRSGVCNAIVYASRNYDFPAPSLDANE